MRNLNEMAKSKPKSLCGNIFHPSKFGTGNGTSIVTPKKYSQFWDFFTLGRHSTVLRFSFCGKNSSTNFYHQPYPPNTLLKQPSRPQIILFSFWSGRSGRCSTALPRNPRCLPAVVAGVSRFPARLRLESLKSQESPESLEV